MYNRNYYQNKKPRHSKKFFRNIFIVIISITILFLLTYAIDSFIIHKGKIYPNITLLNKEIGGLNKEESLQYLQPMAEKAINTAILIDNNGWQLRIIPQDQLNANIEIEDKINEAYSIGRRGSLFFRVKERLSLIKNKYPLKPVVKFENNKIDSFFSDLKSNVERPYEDAIFAIDRIVPARTGIEVDQEQFLIDIENSILSAFDSDDQIIVKLPVIIHNPSISTTEVLNIHGFFKIISKYDTPLTGKGENTLYNIKKAAKEVNGIIINPGETISFNEIVGPAEKDDGYKESTIISNGQFINGYGGGVCQVSTTLYNAALLANLQILERYNHSIYDKPTNYVPIGQDAAVFFGFKDLKVKNSLDQKIVIFTDTDSEVLSVIIWGEKPLDKEIKIVSQDLKTYDYDVLEVSEKIQIMSNLKII